MTLNELIERLSIMTENYGDREVVLRYGLGCSQIADVTTRLAAHPTRPENVQQVVIES